MAKPSLRRREPCFPSPRPSPQRRGSTAASAGKSSPPGDRSQPAETRSLSPGDRARVRGKGVFNCIDTAQRTITLHNRQTTQQLNLRLLRRITRALLHEARPHGAFDLAIYLVAEPEMTRLNETYLRHQGCTDVITFDYAEGAGQASPLPRSGSTAATGASFQHHKGGRRMSPLPTTKEWGEGQGEGNRTALQLQARTLPHEPQADRDGPLSLSLSPTEGERVPKAGEGLVDDAGDGREACPALLHGEIFVCLDEAVSQARRFHVTWPSELVRYVVHGVLHLLGYDDLNNRAHRRMKEAEDTLVRQLARQFDFHSLY